MSNINYIIPYGKGRLYNHPWRYENILSGQIGKLIPIQCDEVNPREYWRQNISFLLRLAPMSAPAMARMNVKFYSFFVPTRILTERSSRHSTWENFIKSVGQKSDVAPLLPSVYTGTPLNGDTYTEEVKTMLKDKFSVGSLSDYLDFPVETEDNIDKDNLFNIPYSHRLLLFGHLAYQMIYNYWFRRDQIEEEIKFPLNFETLDLSDITNSNMDAPEEWEYTEEEYKEYFFNELFKLRDKNYERDYFTSALPSPQFGEDIQIGDGTLSFAQGTFAPVYGQAQISLISELNNTSPYPRIVGTTAPLAAGERSVLGIMGIGNRIETEADPVTSYGVANSKRNAAFYLDPQPSNDQFPDYPDLRANLSNVTGAANNFTINQFRLGMQMQAVREAINRGGTMYLEIMQNVYDSLVPDAKLQQPVYLGGMSCPVQIGAVVQSSETTTTTPLGTLAGKGVAATGGMLFRSKKAFDEHGYVMTIACVAPRTGYIGGIPRKWLKKYPLDYFNKYFAHLGEQQVYKGELHFNPWSGYEAALTTFGYQERYNEYRHPISRAHGEMRTTKDNWHLFRFFDDVPNLGPSFIKMKKEDFDRVFEFETIQGTSNEHFDMQVVIDTTKKSPVPKYGTPYSFI